MYVYIPDTYLETFKLKCEDITYRVDEKNGTVVAVAKFYIPDDLQNDGEHYITTVGIAKVHSHSKDVFNEKTGKKLARAKAEKEAFVRFREIVKKYKGSLVLTMATIDGTVKKMNVYINRQNKYIKSF